MKRLRLLLIGLTALLLLLALAAVLPMRRVSGDEMAWSLRDGELVWIVPMRIRRGDVVLVQDPLDPERRVLRRAIGSPGQKIRVEEGSVRVNGKRIRQQDMGREGEFRILKEIIWSSPPARPNPHFILQLLRPVKWSLDGKVIVPEGHWYLLADDRHRAVDSRWWGPVPESEIVGVVRARWGEADEWRPAFQILLPEE